MLEEKTQTKTTEKQELFKRGTTSYVLTHLAKLENFRTSQIQRCRISKGGLGIYFRIGPIPDSGWTCQENAEGKGGHP